MLREITISHEKQPESLDVSKSTLATMNSSMSSFLRDSTNSRSSSSRRSLRRSLTASDLRVSEVEEESNDNSKTIFHFDNLVHALDASAPELTTPSSNHERRARRRRGTATRDRDGKDRARSSSRRRSLAGLQDPSSSNLTANTKQYSKEDQSKEARRSRRRRSSICHVDQPEGAPQKEDDDARSVSSSRSLRSLKNSLSSLKGRLSRKNAKPKKSHKKRVSREEEMMRGVEEMEQLVKAIKKNPESRKIVEKQLMKLSSH